MTILHMHTTDGAFIAGDSETGLTSYAYPSSEFAEKARRTPTKVAAEMMESESGWARKVAPGAVQRDAERMALLLSHAA